MPVTLPLSGLCTSDDVKDRMNDCGLAVGDTDAAKIEENILRKIDLAHEDLQLDLLGSIQKAIAPFQENYLAQSPSVILTKLYNSEVLKKAAVYYTICGMLEEGELRTRFKWAEAGDEIAKASGRMEQRRKEAYNSAWPQLLFDVDGNGTITTLERMFTNTVTSISASM